jgi:hypothetical protein
VAESDGITGISLNGVRKLIEDKQLPETILDAFSLVSGAVIALAPLAVGPAGAALWPLLEPKNALIDAGKTAIRKLTRAQPNDYVDQARRFAAANTMLTYTAFFDALSRCKSDFIQGTRLTDEDKIYITALAADQVLGAASQSEASSLTDIIKVPYPAAVHDLAAVEFRRRLYRDMAERTFLQIRRLANQRRILLLTERTPSLFERLAALAESVYQAEFLGMAIDYQPFFVWSTLQDQADKGALLRGLSDDLRAAGEDSQLRFELIGAALYSLDLGLDRLSRAIAAQPSPSQDSPRHPESTEARAAEALRRRYAADVERPVIDDSYDPPTGPRLSYPGSAAAYVPQAYRQVRYATGDPLERDDEWTKLPAADDLGPAITRYLESPYSAETPLLILGHPGSGKSLLTRVYAASLQYPRYTVVRVELRDTDPNVSIQQQVEDQIRKDTGYDVNWAELADNLPLSPPIVILDGYDELVQAAGDHVKDYLVRVQHFQRDALIQHRPVRVIVTSRITLIDKAIIPPGATVMRLEPFDERRRTEWIDRWNVSNAAYFQQSGVKRFRLRDPKLVGLAEQPLLLLMLAIFDSAGNSLSERPDLDQTLLYDELLRRFIERELGKGEHGASFSGLRPEERRPWVDRELNRLGVAAISMFNRQEVKILLDQLDKDLAYFGAERQVPGDLNRQRQSELLLGSFFFIHESRSRITAEGTANDAPHALASGKAAPAAGSTAFEFLHNTFGEFLAADFILRRVIENAEAIRDLSGKPTLEHDRHQRLNSLTPYWFASLLYTPLHTRPNILTMLSEWSFHLLPADPSARAELLFALDDIVRTQLRTILVGTDPLDLSARARSVARAEPTPTPPPYDPLPVLGHVAVYTLNLILLRTYLADETYTLEETALEAGHRPWDRLTALWRSWFTPESLGALATQFTATRTGDQLRLAPTLSVLLTAALDSPLFVAFETAIALADNLTAESMGLHVFSLVEMEMASATYLPNLGKRFNEEARPLALVADSVLRRLDGHHPELPAAVLDEFTRLGSGTSELMLGFAEFTDRVVLAPRQRIEIAVSQGDLREMARLSRYASAVITDLCADLDSHWLRRLLSGDGTQYEDFTATWRVFLSSPAAAPVLRAAVTRLSGVQCANVAGWIRAALPGGEITPFDVDTAAALAVLAWRGSDEELCARTIDALLRGCERDAWNLLDIPLETWGGLADLFVEARASMATRRTNFAAVLTDHLEGFVPATGVTAYDRSRKLADLWLHALRIGSVRDREHFLPFLTTLVTAGSVSLERRRWFLLLLRWARENDETQFVTELFSQAVGSDACPWWTHFGAPREVGPAAIDLDRASADLTYREAMDLRWALDLWRESGGHWRAEPSDLAGSDPAAESPSPSAKRLRLRR